MKLQINAPFVVLQDRAGNPLSSGYVYIGVANQNPITHPISVYWDEDGTATVTQPIRTSGGYLVRNGTPANVFVGSAFSIVVKDRDLTLVYSAPNVPAGSADIGFIQAGSGAVIRTAQSKMREIVSAEDFGAVANGSTESGAFFNVAIDAMFSAGGGTVTAYGEEYLIETPILQKSNVCIELGANTKLIAKTGLNGPIIRNATNVSVQSVSGISVAARLATAVCSSHGYAPGDWVQIAGATPGGYNGWHKIITTPTGDTFTFYVDKNIAPDSGSITVFKAVEANLKVIGGLLVGNAANTTGNNNGVRYDGVNGFEIHQTRADGMYDNGIHIRSAVTGQMVGVRGDNSLGTSSNGILLGESLPAERYADRVSLLMCEGDGNPQDGIIYERGSGGVLEMCSGQYNGVTGIKLAKASNVQNIAGRGLYNVSCGCQIQGSGGNHDIDVFDGEYLENGESGILITNPDTVSPMTDIRVHRNNCHRNGQINISTSYGIAIEGTPGAIIDRISVDQNGCNDQGRGISVGVSGTVSNLSVFRNSAKGNVNDANFGVAQASTLSYGLNDFANSGGNGLILPMVTTTSFEQLLGKSSGAIAAPADTNPNVLATVVVGAGVLGTNGQLFIEGEFTFTNNGNNKTLTVAFGGTSLSNVTLTTELSSAFRIVITNNNDATQQRFYTQRFDGSTVATGASTLTKDTTGAVSITISATKASAGDAVTLERYAVKALRNS